MSHDFRRFTDTVGTWLESEGAEHSIAISTRVRLARNIEGFNFVSRLSAERARELETLLSECLLSSSLADDLEYVSMAELDEQQRLMLVERHLITRELAFLDRARGVAFGDGERVSIMVNEEDHLRIQVFRPGFAIEECWSEIERIDQKLEKELKFAFSERLGYLTACPTNVGTGMRVSVMLHLPALKMAPEEIKRVFAAAAKTNLAIRGIHGEGTRDVGNIYQISNQITLGRSEFQIREDLSSVVPAVVNFERSVRRAWIEGRRQELEQRLERSLDELLEAEKLSTDQALGLISDMRLGIDLGLLDGYPRNAFNRLMILMQPGHLQVRAGRELEPDERDVARAELIREVLGEEG